MAYVLSGFLGAGKTSLLRHILDQLQWTSDTESSQPNPSNTVVLINEFGQLGLDGRLVEKDGLNLYELNSGCICCTLHDELGRTLEKILQQCAPQHILIEASGVADPLNIARNIAEFPSSRLRLAKCVSLLDSRMWSRRAALGRLFQSQLAEADLLVLNKTDLLPPEKLDALVQTLKSTFPKVQICTAQHGHIPPELFWKESSRGHARGVFLSTLHGSIDPDFQSVTFSTHKAFSRSAFENFLAHMPEGILRAKGQIVFGEEKCYLDFSDGHIVWSEPPSGIDDTCMVFIGAPLDGAALIAQLQNIADNS